MAKEKLFQERRGRKKSTDPLEPITIYVNHSIITGSNELIDTKSEEYRLKLSEIKRKLTEHVYSKLADRNSPLAISPNI